jgi:hypothetical protein
MYTRSLTFFLNSSPPLCLGTIVEHDLVAVDVELVVRARHIFVRLDAHLGALVEVIFDFISGRPSRGCLSFLRHYDLQVVMRSRVGKSCWSWVENFSRPLRKIRQSPSCPRL